MKIKSCCLQLLFVLCFAVAYTQTQSPEAFLGYKPGEKFTPHFKIMDYLNHLANANRDRVKLVTYGSTNEGRPLITLFISSEENMRSLENIRQNNLRLANMSRDKAMPVESTPVIVWLSYNVHGNEASSSEAAMVTAYELLNPVNSKAKSWLNNTLVVIDPCVNPDGRDRYINWYNSVVGMRYNPALEAREHREPWPGGRTNHYYFDLNRDWAWQTQIESQKRMKLYQEWLPQIHVDFHEQGINSPYYFAPAAQPYHEVITPWQRDFQITIGKNNAKYFDEQGWLYFTKEIFDLYYPSYGDTYPLYNGAVGMTYEQAGGGAAGLGALKKEGDTLTLTDRLTHHFTSAMSTIEISSLNAGRLIHEFRKFFNDAVSNGTGVFKTYVIKRETGDLQRITAFLNLLDRNQIRYGTAAQGPVKGYNYFTGKEESLTIGAGDIVINNNQPKSTLLTVLFEPKSKLVDSATYDITAWSLPYVYGLKTWGLKERIQLAGEYRKPDPVVNQLAGSYGYVVPWEGMQSARVVSQLLQKGVRLRFTTEGFETGGMAFNAGSIIILKTSNGSFGGNLWNVIHEICNRENLKIFPVNSGLVDKGYDFGSSNVKYLKPPKIALLAGDGVSANAAGEVWFFMERELEYPVTLLRPDDLIHPNFRDIDVLILPDGRYPFLKYANYLELKSWVNNGGKLIAMENAVAALAKIDTGGIVFKKEVNINESEDVYAPLRKFKDYERDFIPYSTPGSIFKVHLDNSHPLAFGYPDYYFTLKMDDNVYQYLSEGWNVGVIKKDDLVAGFVGSKLKKQLMDGLVFGVQDMGRGRVIYLTDNVLFRNFWQNGKLLFCNALFLVGQ